MIFWKKIVGVWLFMMLSVFCFSQKEIYGTVEDENGEPLFAANVVIKGLAYGDVTDLEGKYKIQHNQDSVTLAISYTGYKTLEITKDTGLLNVVLYEMIITHGHGPRVTVIDSRIHSAHNYSKLDERILSLQNKSELTSILNTSPGLLMHSGALNTNRITIRGIGNRSPFSTNKIKAVLNDIPLTTGSGETTIEDIDLSFIKNIQIWKGPSSSIYGAGLGGLIQLNTFDKTSEPTYFSIKNSIGSYGLIRNTADVRLHDSKEKFNIHLNYNSTRSDGYRENNEYNRNGLTLFSNTNFGKNKISVLLNYISLEAFIPSSLNENDFLNAPTKAAFTWGNIKGFEDYDKFLAGISFTHKASSSVKTIFSFFTNYRDSYESRPFNILTEKSNATGFRWIWNFIPEKISGLDFRIGTELFRETYDWQTFKTNNGNLEDLLSINKEIRFYNNAFTEFTYRFNQKLKFNAGLNLNNTKYDLEDRFFADSIDQSGDYLFNPILSPRITFSFSPKYNNDYYIMASHGFSPPSLEETLTPDGSINTDIQPETGWNFEIGTRFFPKYKKLKYEVSFFTMLIKDLLVARRTALDQYIGINAGKTIHTGLELHFDWNILNREKVNIKLNNNYTYSNFKFKEFIDDDNDYSGNELTGTAPHILNTILFFNLDKLYGNLNFQYVDSQPLTDANTVYSDAYSLLNFKLGYQLIFAKKWNVDFYAGLNNILNEKYSSMHQINASSFGGNAPRYYYPGLPRNYYVGIDLRYDLKN